MSIPASLMSWTKAFLWNCLALASLVLPSARWVFRLLYGAAWRYDGSQNDFSQRSDPDINLQR